MPCPTNLRSSLVALALSLATLTFWTSVRATSSIAQTQSANSPSQRADQKRAKGQDQKPTGAAAALASDLGERDASPFEGRALILLDQILASLKEVDEAKLRIRAQAQIADLLWKYDAARARRLLEGAFRAASDLKEERSSSPPPSSRSDALSATQSRLILQGEILRIAIKHDSELAERLVKTISEQASQSEGQKVEDASQDALNRLFNRSFVLLQMASTIMGSDPALAARLIRQSLDTDVNPMFAGVLFMLKVHDRARADEIYRVALQKLKLQPAGNVLMSLSVYAMPTPFMAFLPLNLSTLSARERAVLNDDPQLAREYLEVVFAKLTECAEASRAGGGAEMGRDSSCLATAQMLAPAYDRYLPDKSAMVRALRDELQRRAGEDADPAYPLFEKESAQELISRAENEKEELKRALLYFRATRELVRERRFAEAISTADKIEREDFRSLAADLTRLQAAYSHINDGDFDTALRYARQISRLQFRAITFANMAQVALNRNDLARAAEFVDETRRLIEQSEDSPEKIQALIITAGVTARFDALRAFDLMRRGVELANRLDENQRASVDLFSPSAMRFSPEDPLSIATPFRLLARADFDRALELARSFKNAERRIIAQIAIAHSALSEEPKKQANQ